MRRRELPSWATPPTEPDRTARLPIPILTMNPQAARMSRIAAEIRGGRVGSLNERKACNQCQSDVPLKGMSWCGPCGIKFNQARTPSAEDTADEIAERIAYIRRQMALQFGVENGE